MSIQTRADHCVGNTLSKHYLHPTATPPGSTTLPCTMIVPNILVDETDAEKTLFRKTDVE